MTSAHPRITTEAGKRDGKPCISGMRITVNDELIRRLADILPGLESV